MSSKHRLAIINKTCVYIYIYIAPLFRRYIPGANYTKSLPTYGIWLGCYAMIKIVMAPPPRLAGIKLSRYQFSGLITAISYGIKDY